MEDKNDKEGLIELIGRAEFKENGRLVQISKDGKVESVVPVESVAYIQKSTSGCISDLHYDKVYVKKSK
ncbi:hypothetical protein HY642_02375 [Candidatus Woesearchaeota archaeon]|nr:hypothetical protein [Candidatus Woesearchaeota archaeon]